MWIQASSTGALSGGRQKMADLFFGLALSGVSPSHNRRRPQRLVPLVLPLVPHTHTHTNTHTHLGACGKEITFCLRRWQNPPVLFIRAHWRVNGGRISFLFPLLLLFGPKYFSQERRSSHFRSPRGKSTKPAGRPHRSRPLSPPLFIPVSQDDEIFTDWFEPVLCASFPSRSFRCAPHFYDGRLDNLINGRESIHRFRLSIRVAPSYPLYAVSKYWIHSRPTQ